MKRTFATAILLGGLCSTSFAQLWFSLEAPQDNDKARRGVHDWPELQPLRAAYSEISQTRLLPLTPDGVAKVFGPKLGTATNWWEDHPTAGGGNTGQGPKLDKYPADLVLPIFVSGKRSVPGLHSANPVNNKNHTDLHAVGDIGYVEFYYNGDGERLLSAVIYFRADDEFVPLTSTNDFSKRLEWEKAKFAALTGWLDEHMPKQTDLGVVEVAGSGPSRVDLGGGMACILNTQVAGASVESNRPTILLFVMTIEKETQDPKERQESRRYESFRPGEPVGFSMNGKFYRLTPKPVVGFSMDGKFYPLPPK